MAKIPGEIVLEPRRFTPEGSYEVKATGLSAEEAIVARRITTKYADKMNAVRGTPDGDATIAKVGMDITYEFERAVGGKWFSSVVAMHKGFGGGAHTSFVFPSGCRTFDHYLPGMVISMYGPPVPSEAKTEEEIKVVAKKKAYAKSKKTTRSNPRKMKRFNDAHGFVPRLELPRRVRKLAEARFLA